MTSKNYTEYLSDPDDTADDRTVYVYTTVDEEKRKYELDPRVDLHAYSDGTFTWGSTDDGALQLGLAILADFYDDDIAMKHHEEFTEKVIAKRPDDVFFWLQHHDLADAVRGLDVRHGYDDFPKSDSGPVTSVTVVSDEEELDERVHYFGELLPSDTVEFVAVDAGRLHVRHDGVHYIGAGTATDVEPGDVFYYPRGFSDSYGDPPVITTVERIEESEHESMEYPDAILDVGERMNVGLLIGAPMNMAQLSPPELLIPK